MNVFVLSEDARAFCMNVLVLSEGFHPKGELLLVLLRSAFHSNIDIRL
jgi:hypothetical protein